MTQLYANNAKSTLASGVTDVATSFSLSVGTGALFPSPTGGDFFMATLFEYGTVGEINHEIVKCTARSGDTLTVERGQESTTNRAWSAGTRLELRLTKAALDTYVTKTDPQTLTTKTIVAANNTITTAASGNLTSTELNAALAELQTDVDTRALQTYASAINDALTNHDALTSGTHGVTGNILGTEDVYDTPVDGVTWLPVSSNWAYDHQNAATGTHGVTGTILGTEDVDDVPVDAATTAPISSNWAYDHVNGADPHPVYPRAAGAETISGTWTFSSTLTASGQLTVSGLADLNAGIDLEGFLTEEVYDLTGTSISSANGTIQTKTLAANTTFTYSMNAGDSVTLMLDTAGTYTVTWPTTNWEGGSAPTLTSNGSNEYDVIVITKIGTVYYAKYIGMFT